MEAGLHASVRRIRRSSPIRKPHPIPSRKRCLWCRSGQHLIACCDKLRKDKRDGYVITNDMGRVALANGQMVPRSITGPDLRTRMMTLYRLVKQQQANTYQYTPMAQGLTVSPADYDEDIIMDEDAAIPGLGCLQYPEEHHCCVPDHAPHHCAESPELSDVEPMDQDDTHADTHRRPYSADGQAAANNPFVWIPPVDFWTVRNNNTYPADDSDDDGSIFGDSTPFVYDPDAECLDHAYVRGHGSKKHPIDLEEAWI
uniref:PiggyBac transposable element-derived protein domain-containing protein n=1 Tax=Mycena chlorophos TaxID=658473 RepID=A0ABQ0LBA3_MYCCL|nr:predicted protein [Mycena chlorophos]